MEEISTDALESVINREVLEFVAKINATSIRSGNCVDFLQGILLGNNTASLLSAYTELSTSTIRQYSNTLEELGLLRINNTTADGNRSLKKFYYTLKVPSSTIESIISFYNGSRPSCVSAESLGTEVSPELENLLVVGHVEEFFNPKEELNTVLSTTEEPVTTVPYQECNGQQSEYLGKVLTIRELQIEVEELKSRLTELEAAQFRQRLR
jgi:hypothetical protein